MKSRTSFSKIATFKKDLTRFAPIWALYLIAMMLLMMESGYYISFDQYANSFVADLSIAFAVVNLCYAGLIAVVLFGDLYNTRMCYSLHTMPQRRESWLLSHLASGFLFSLIPNLLACLFLMYRLEDYWFIGLYWLLSAELQFIFFYGVAVVSALLVGNRFAMLAVYAGLNFVSMLAYATVETIYLPLLPGVSTNLESFAKFSPVYYMADQFEYFRFESVDVYISDMYGYDVFYKYLGLGDGWGYMAILAGLGLVLMGLAFLLYRWRHLECAGDFIAFSKLKAPACAIMTLCVALCFAVFGDLFDTGYVIWLIVGVIVGYFGSLMLLERRLKVFRVKTWIGFGVFSAVLAGSIFLMAIDAFGIVSWTPDASKVESVTIANYNSDNYFYNDYYYGSRVHTTLTEEAEIEEIIEAHQDILDRMNYPKDSVHRVVLTYRLKNGRTVKRSYLAQTDGKNYEIISKYFYTPENILGYGEIGWEEYLNSVEYIWFDGGEIPRQLYEKLLTAVKADCEAGHVFMESSKEDVYFYMDIQIEYHGDYSSRSIAIGHKAENTIALMQQPEMILGYTEWEAYLHSVNVVFVGGNPVDGDVKGLLEALRQDCLAGHVSARYKDVGVIPIEIETYTGFRSLNIDLKAEHTLAWLKENGYTDIG